MKCHPIPVFALRRFGAVLCLLAACAVSGPVQAQAPVASPSQAELAEKVMALWHLEELAVRMVQQPALDAAQQARMLVSARVPADKRESVMKLIGNDVAAFVGEAEPIARTAARQLMPGTVGKLLEERFTRDELLQLVAILESPVRAKFDRMVPELQRTFGNAISASARDRIDPKLKALSQALGDHVRAAATP